LEPHELTSSRALFTPAAIQKIFNEITFPFALLIWSLKEARLTAEPPTNPPEPAITVLIVLGVVGIIKISLSYIINFLSVLIFILAWTCLATSFQVLILRVS
jgi:hypothetical protein